MLKDKWKLDSLIGVGGMAAVYAATHRNSKRVAVKMLHPELSIDSAIKQRFLREGYVANQVGHNGAVMVDDDDVADDGSAFLVMELLEGEPLDVRMNRKGGILPVAEVLALADQLLDTLAHAHDNGIVHRDLKPENLFLTKDGVLKVLDFGIARLMEGMSGPSTSTQDGSVMGTPAFMAPEQARGRWPDVDTRTDLWAVGATMFTLITGRLVHEADTVQEALVLAVTQRAPSIGSIDPGLPFSVVDAIDRALIYEKECRWQDAHSMKAAVRAAHRDIRGTSTMVMPVPSVAHHEIPPFELTPTSARKSSGNVSVSTGPGVSATVAGPTASIAGRESLAPRRRALLAFAAGGVLALIALVVVAMSTLAPHDRVGQPLAQPTLGSRDVLEVQQSEQQARTAPALPPAPQPVTVKGAVDENVQAAGGARPASAQTVQSRPKPRTAPKPKKAPAGTVDDPFSTRF